MRRNQRPSVCLEESLEFIIHGRTPFRGLEGLRNRGRNSDVDRRERGGTGGDSVRFRGRPWDGAICEGFGFNGVIFGSRDHGVSRNRRR